MTAPFPHAQALAADTARIGRRASMDALHTRRSTCPLLPRGAAGLSAEREQSIGPQGWVLTTSNLAALVVTSRAREIEATVPGEHALKPIRAKIVCCNAPPKGHF